MSFCQPRVLCIPLIISLGLSISQSAHSAVEIIYGYDDLNRLTQVTRADGPVVDYDYTENGNFTVQSVSNSPDTDNDQIANFADLDDDNDGMPDSWEMEFGLDPLNSADAAQDADGDGVSNLQEFLDGTSPLASNTPVQIPFVPIWGLAVFFMLLTVVGSLRHKRRQQANQGI